MSTIATLITQIKFAYGLARDTAEDPLFTDLGMIDKINEAHHWFAEVTRCYMGKLSAALVINQSYVYLDPTVIEVDVQNVVIYNGAAYHAITFRQKSSLIAQYGALQSVAAVAPASITNFYLRPGIATASRTLAMELYPMPNAGQAGGLLYDAYVYPADFTATSDTVPFPPGWIPKFVPIVCWRLALLEEARGRPGSPSEKFHELAVQGAMALAEVMRRATGEPNPRTALVGMTSGEDAQRRRDYSLRAGMGGGQ